MDKKELSENDLTDMYKKGLLTDAEFRAAIVSLNDKQGASSGLNIKDLLGNPRVLAISIATTLLIIVAVWFFAFRTKDNYLIVGNTARITTKAGIYIRTEPNNTTGRSIGLIPYDQTFDVLEEGNPQTIYRINSRWYWIRHKDKVGWAWGGFAKHD